MSEKEKKENKKEEKIEKVEEPKREMDWHLYTWGEHVKVIKPADWRK